MHKHVAGLLLTAITALPAVAADLLVNHTDTLDPVPAGGTVEYLLRVDNNGGDTAVNAVLTDTLPAGTTFVGTVVTGGVTCAAPVASVVTCQLGNVASLANVTVRVRVRAATVITNSASL